MRVIEKSAELAGFCAEISGAKAVYIDTEFVGEGRYYPEVGAIQIATEGREALVDPLAVEELGPLFAILVDKKTEKVFHAGGQDLAIFHKMMGRPTAPIFDTQVAAALLGCGEQLSLGNLVFLATKKRLRKSHAFTDWLKRPLEESQVEYALEDVRCLAEVHAYLARELELRGRTGWAKEEFAGLEATENYLEVDAQKAFRRIRGHDRLGPEELSRLREIAAWREETARKHNLTPSRLCMDAGLMNLARRPPETVEGLYEVRGVRAREVRRFGREMLEALWRGADKPPPELYRPPSLQKELEPTVDFLVLCLRILAAEKEISPGMLANRGDLAEVVMYGEKARVPLLRGWRRKAVGEALLATLQGQATAHIAPNNRRVHLDWREE